MFINSSGLVGVNTTSLVADALLPIQINAVATTGQAYFASNNNGSYGLLMGYDNANGYARIRNVSNTPLTLETNNAERMRITSGGGLKIFNSSPNWAGDGMELWYNGTTTLIGSYNRGTSTFKDMLLYASNTIFENGGSQRMRITSDGNVGIGVVPSSWLTSTITPLQVKNSSFAGYSIGGVHINYVGSNWFYDGFDRYIANGFASIFTQAQGEFNWATAPSGTAGNAITFIPVMKITSGGVVQIANLSGSGSRTVTADASGNLSASSDSSLKKEDKEYKIQGLVEILQLQPRAYKWLSDIEIRGEEALTELGFFADEVNPIIPSAAPKGNDDLFGFYDRAIIAALVKAIQEQQAQIEELKNKLNV
jgi:hypothetical protein